MTELGTKLKITDINPVTKAVTLEGGDAVRRFILMIEFKKSLMGQDNASIGDIFNINLTRKTVARQTQKKQPTKSGNCSGSGEFIGMKFANDYTSCSVCGRVFRVTQMGEMRRHK